MLARFVRALLVLLPLLPLSACTSKPASVRPPRRAAAQTASATSTKQPPARREPPAPLYSAREALRDVLSGPWEYVDTGPWPGNSRTDACVFHNERVFVVNAYCTQSEAPASRIDVYSPKRGRVRIYAEGNGPISARSRGEYFTFMVESEPPPGPQAAVPPLSLGMTFDELYAYEQQRYEAFLPTCFGGEQRSQAKQSCLEGLATREAQWAKRHHGFLKQPGPAWYHVVRKVRSLAQHYGTEPK